MHYFSSFTGAGGFDLAVPEDWQRVGFSEIDKYANMVLRYRFPDVKNYGDINAIKWEEVPDFEVLFGGTPCQDLSMAGKRAGLSGKRSGLFFEFARCLTEKKPNYFIWENVGGALSSNGGWDFARVLIEFTKRGYDVQWQILNAKDFGVPQNRQRIFVIGHLRNRSIREVFYKPKNSEPYNEGVGSRISYALDASYYKGTNTTKKSRRQLIEISDNQPQGNRIYSSDELSVTLKAEAGGQRGKTGLYEVIVHNMQPRSPTRPSADRGGSGHLTRNDGITYTVDTGNTNAVEINKRIRRLTPLECERLMGWEDEWTKYGIGDNGNKITINDTQRYKMCGNGVVSNVVKWLIENVILRDNHA